MKIKDIFGNLAKNLYGSSGSAESETDSAETGCQSGYSEWKRLALNTVETGADRYIEMSDLIWENPELSLKEFKAAEIFCEALREEGFEVEENLCGIPTAFSGSFGEGRPVIGILGEYDALSGLSQKACAAEKLIGEQENGCGHGCGHNLLGTASFAAAVAVKRYLEEAGCPGTVVFYGCPGKESGGGKAYMAREGIWKNLDAALCWHPSDVNQVKTGTNNASIQVLYRFNGVSAHASADPENGRSALDAVELMNTGVQYFREHVTPGCRIHYAVTDAGGISPNVVQAHAEVLYMTSANKVRECIRLQQRVDDIAKGAALMTGTTFERVFVGGTAELLPNYTLENLIYKNLCEVGTPEYTEEELAFADKLKSTFPEPASCPGIGPRFDEKILETVMEQSEGLSKPMLDFIYPLHSCTNIVPGSTDVGDVSWLTPTAQVETATWPAGIPGHSWQIAAIGKSTIAHKGMLCAAKVLAGTAIDLIEDDELLTAAEEEFRKRSASGYECPIEPDAVPVVI